MLDPMAGVGTTVVEGMLLGRNVVGVDIEEKFCKLIEGNLKNVEKTNEKSRFKLRLGKAVVVKGDSRQLAQLLQDKMDVVVTSPPYASGGWKADENPANPIEREKRRKQLFPMRPPDPGRYSSDPSNIGNLPHENNADVVITSPPYSGSVSKHAGGDKVRERFEGFMGESQLAARKYSEDERNIGNLADHGKVDVVVTSPPYSEALSKRRKGYTKVRNLEHTREYPQDSRDDNVGNLQHGTVDTVITSPPFGEEKSFQMFNGPRATNRKGDDSKTRVKKDYVKSEHPYNVGRLPYAVDTVITSPPFGEANRGSGIAKKGYSGKHGVDPKLHERHDRPLSDDPNNISNLPFEQGVDVVLTSPPFTDRQPRQHTPHLLTKEKDMDNIKKLEHGYSESKENIGNLPLGEVDTVITSPPYADGYKASSKSREAQAGRVPKNLLVKNPKGGGALSLFTSEKNVAAKGFLEGMPKTEGNIGNLPLGKVDTVITSPPYADSSKGDSKSARKGWEKLAKDPTSKRFGRKSHPSVGVEYSKDPNNIGNLAHGNGVDAVITSPPYANIHQVPSNSAEWTVFFQQMLQEKGYIEWQGKRYTEAEWRRMNHGRIDGRSTKGLKKDAHYSDNPENIGNLEHEGNIDAIVTSPPYEATFNVKQHTLSGIAKRDPNFRREVGGYGREEANIGNLRREKEGVDAVITSPPFEASVSAPNDPERRAERMRRAGLDPKTIVGGKARCGQIDWQYSESNENVGNLKGETYLSAMVKVYREMYKVLKPNGLAIIVLKNFIRHFKVVDLIGDTVKIMEHVGFKLERKIKFKLPVKSFWRLLYEQKWVERFHKPLPPEFESVYNYETVLVFKKRG